MTVAQPTLALPFLKFAGGKRKLIPEIIPYIPEKFGAYHEPFVGGGALYFYLQATRPHRYQYAVIADTNERLIRTYRGIRDGVGGVIKKLKRIENNKQAFLTIRRRFNHGRIDIAMGDDTTVAAYLIYLNKTCFNGLYRTNKKGEFNVPFGNYENPTICDEANLRACCLTLADETYIRAKPFWETMKDARKGDFVYCDPPYAPLSDTSNFTAYGKNGFGEKEHIQLRDAALTLKKRGVRVLISNSNCTFVRSLYERDFKIKEVKAARSINSNADRRGNIKELLIL